MENKESNRSGWVSIVAVLGIIMGSLGIMGGVQFAIMPKIYKMQQEMLPEMMKNMQGGINATQVADKEAFSESYKKTMEKMLSFPKWFEAFSYIAGALGGLIGAFYLYSSIIMLQKKKTALKIFIAAIITSMVFVILRGVGLVATQSFYAYSALFGSFFSLVVNGVLLAVVLNGDKSGLVE